MKSIQIFRLNASKKLVKGSYYIMDNMTLASYCYCVGSERRIYYYLPTIFGVANTYKKFVNLFIAVTIHEFVHHLAPFMRHGSLLDKIEFWFKASSTVTENDAFKKKVSCTRD